MKKIISLIKASMTENMSLFKIKTKNQSKSSKTILPIFLTICIFFSIWSYANIIMEQLDEANLEYVGLTLFVFVTTLLTLVEGIYKSSNLLFNCKDDDLLLSMPIKKSTVLFLRIFKFYVFELFYNSIFLIPAMVAYIRYVNVNLTFYVSSFIALLILPIIPIIISCIIGGIISAFSSKFKFKNLAQIVFTMLFLIIVLYFSFNIQGLISNIAVNANSINEIITKLYYPAGAYINLVTNFNIFELLIFILINVLLFASVILILSNKYFKINSKFKVVKLKSSNYNYNIKAAKPEKALIKKELGRFASSPVFVINAGFGVLLFLFRMYSDSSKN